MLDRSNQTIRNERHDNIVAEGARFDCCTIIDTVFVGCDFYWGSFSMTKFVRTNFEWCDLRGADFKQCTFEDCVFSDCNLMAGPIGGPASFDGTSLDGIRFLRCHGDPSRDTPSIIRQSSVNRATHTVVTACILSIFAIANVDVFRMLSEQPWLNASDPNVFNRWSSGSIRGWPIEIDVSMHPRMETMTTGERAVQFLVFSWPAYTVVLPDNSVGTYLATISVTNLIMGGLVIWGCCSIVVGIRRKRQMSLLSLLLISTLCAFAFSLFRFSGNSPLSIGTTWGGVADILSVRYLTLFILNACLYAAFVWFVCTITDRTFSSQRSCVSEHQTPGGG